MLSLHKSMLVVLHGCRQLVFQCVDFGVYKRA